MTNGTLRTNRKQIKGAAMLPLEAMVATLRRDGLDGDSNRIFAELVDYANGAVGLRALGLVVRVDVGFADDAAPASRPTRRARRRLAKSQRLRARNRRAA